tara:strand:+ start:3007 stop:3213 length:207 start_codon:yes stop_codon:yes gene_type:complete
MIGNLVVKDNVEDEDIHTVQLHFRQEDVSACWKYEEQDENYINVVLAGTMYSLEFDSFLYDELVAELT